MKTSVSHICVYDIDLNDGSAPSRVVRMVGTDKRVLEVGAGAGSITRVLHGTAGCRVTALEIEAESIRKLEPFCERVYRIDLNDASWPEALSGEDGFDVVVAADVLEHLVDPWSALERMKPFLGRDGYLVISLPHAGHSSVIACLLDGDFPYRDWGLLDSGHIRFFGMKNIQGLFEGAGLKIVEAQFVVNPPTKTELAEAWERIPGEAKRALAANRFGNVYQVVVKAVPAEREGRGLSLLSLPVEDPGADLLAALVPHAGWRKALRSRTRALLGPGLISRIRAMLPGGR